MAAGGTLLACLRGTRCRLLLPPAAASTLVVICVPFTPLPATADSSCVLMHTTHDRRG